MLHHHDHHAPMQHPLEHGKIIHYFLIATVINLLFVIAEVVYALLADSVSLLADAGHNFSDVIGLTVSGIAMWLLKKPSNNKYSYGFKGATILAALLNAVLLIGMTLAIAIDAIARLHHPVAVQENTIIIVAAIGIVVNGGTALLFIKYQHDLNVKSAFLHLAYDALLSLGVVILGILILWTHWLWLDPLVGMLIAIVILYSAWALLRQSLDLSLDAVPHTIDPVSVYAYLRCLPMVIDAHHLHIWALSTQEVALTVHLAVSSGTLGNDIMEQIRQELAERFKIHHATLQVEQALVDKKKCSNC